MFTFLPKSYRSEVLTEHRLRVVLVFSVMVTVSLALGAILALPTFFVSSAQKSSMLVEKERLLKAADSTRLDEVTAQINGIQRKIDVLSVQSERRPLISIVEKVLAQLDPGVSLSGIALHKEAGIGAIVISGAAETRDGLVQFSNNLRGEPSFTKVELPVSSLAKSKDIIFSIRVESSF
jgi:Tfp pilus assembly protein PilN